MWKSCQAGASAGKPTIVSKNVAAIDFRRIRAVHVERKEPGLGRNCQLRMSIEHEAQQRRPGPGRAYDDRHRLLHVMEPVRSASAANAQLRTIHAESCAGSDEAGCVAPPSPERRELGILDVRLPLKLRFLRADLTLEFRFPDARLALQFRLPGCACRSNSASQARAWRWISASRTLRLLAAMPLPAARLLPKAASVHCAPALEVQPLWCAPRARASSAARLRARVAACAKHLCEFRIPLRAPARSIERNDRPMRSMSSSLSTGCAALCAMTSRCMASSRSRYRSSDECSRMKRETSSRIRRIVAVDRREDQLSRRWTRQQAQTEIVLPPPRNRFARHQAGKTAPVDHDHRATDRQRFQRGARAREHQIVLAKARRQVVDFASDRRSENVQLHFALRAGRADRVEVARMLCQDQRALRSLPAAARAVGKRRDPRRCAGSRSAPPDEPIGTRSCRDRQDRPRHAGPTAGRPARCTRPLRRGRSRSLACRENGRWLRAADRSGWPGSRRERKAPTRDRS